MTGNQRIEIFTDTQNIIRNDPVLQAHMVKCQAESQLYFEDYVSPLRKVKGAGSIEVTDSTTFRCAQNQLAQFSKIAVLNFANPHEPGGGVLRGAQAQEECLCRCSDLYPALAQPYFFKHFYQYHYRNCGNSFSDRLIYSPNVTVLKSDDPVPQKLDIPFYVDVITCAAPFRDDWDITSDEELLSIYKSRIKNILEVAMSRDVDCLILGAFGCGAFRNDPVLMSQAFADLLVQQQYAAYFEKVIFAIKRSGFFCQNLDAFRSAFPNTKQ